MKLIDIKKMTLDEADKFYKNTGMSFIFKDGSLKGFQK